MSDPSPPDSSRTPPDWSHLPANPMAFFNLNDRSSRRDLKLAYNRLIKQFKPEKHPQEFQQIRLAYEQLDHEWTWRDRLGLHATTSSDGSIDLNSCDSQTTSQLAAEKSSPDETSPVPERVRPPKPALPPLSDFVRTADWPEVESRLTHEASTQVVGRWQLLLYEESAQLDTPIEFARRLLRQHQLESTTDLWHTALTQVLPETINAPQFPELLLEIARAIPNDGFYWTTTQSILAWAKQQPFADVIHTLELCRAEIRDAGQYGEWNFRLEFAMQNWPRSPSGWLEAEIHWLETCGIEVPSYRDFDIEFLYRLIPYAAERDLFIGRHPLRDKIDEVIRLYGAAPRVEFEKSLVESIEQIRDLDQTLATFHSKDDPPTNAAFVVYSLVSMSYHTELLSPDEQTFQKLVKQRFRKAFSLGNPWIFLLRFLRGSGVILGGIAVLSGMILTVYKVMKTDFVRSRISQSVDDFLTGSGLLLSIFICIVVMAIVLRWFSSRTIRKAYFLSFRRDIAEAMFQAQIDWGYAQQVAQSQLSTSADYSGVTTWLFADSAFPWIGLASVHPKESVVTSE